MSTTSSRPPVRYQRNPKRKRPVLNVDLNVPLPSENHDHAGTSTHAGPQTEQVSHLGVSITPAAIDVEALDDDVVISSPRAFAAAKNNSRRANGRTVVFDVESEVQSSKPSPSQRRQRRRHASNEINVYVNLEGSGFSTKESLQRQQQPPPPPPPPKEPAFTCPVCMCPLVEETSTKCGHIFCRACIKASIAAQSKCPTCRRKISNKDIIRIYLPATN